jgi:hypothetical protein
VVSAAIGRGFLAIFPVLRGVSAARRRASSGTEKSVSSVYALITGCGLRMVALISEFSIREGYIEKNPETRATIRNPARTFNVFL